MGITGLILAGGQGKRMGGQDKGLTLLAKRPLIAHVIDAIKPQVDSIIIGANNNLAEYRGFGYEVCEDSLGNHQGPLAGILVALQRVNEKVNETNDKESLMVVPCDAPLLPSDLVSRLLRAVDQSDALAVIPHDGERLQPLYGLYSVKTLSSLENFLKSGERKVGVWVESLSPLIVDFSDQTEKFLNINTSEELSDIEISMNGIENEQ